MADLVFSRPRYTGGPVDLVFGGEGGGVGSGDATVTITATLPAPTFTALVSYDNRNPRRVSTSARMPHQVANRALPTVRASWRPSAPEVRQERTTWQQADRVAREVDSGWRLPGRILDHRAVRWLTAVPVGTQAAMVHQVAEMVRAQAVAQWLVADPLHVTSRALHQVGQQVHTDRLAAWVLASQLQVLGISRRQVADALALSSLWPWGVARVVPPGREVWPPVDPGGVTPRVPSTHLVFACPPWLGGPVNLVFGRVCAVQPPQPGGVLQILPARFYMSVHSLTAYRLPEMSPVPIYDVSISADQGSFGWTLQINAPANSYHLLAPDGAQRAQVRVILDGLSFDGLVLSRSQRDQFGQRGCSITARSITALLAKPFARQTQHLSTQIRSAQQLALDALEFTGFDLDWGLVDWLVPAGAWSHSGTPLEAVDAIAQAAGGYLQSARSGPTLIVRHLYPDLTGGLPGGPWNWSHPAVVPDVELAPDVLVTVASEEMDGPDINAVYLSGELQGVHGLYRREGTAGEKLAAPITDPLMTSAQVVRQRGRAIIGLGGRKELVTYSLPILAGSGQPGILDIGQLVQINGPQPWRGRVRSVSASAVFGGVVRQSVQIERPLTSV